MDTIEPADLEPGTTIRHRTSGTERTLARRKTEAELDEAGPPRWPGWWLEEGGGIADRVFVEEWEVRS